MPHTITHSIKKYKCPSEVNGWLNQLWYILAMEYYSAIQKGPAIDTLNNLNESPETSTE